MFLIKIMKVKKIYPMINKDVKHGIEIISCCLGYNSPAIAYLEEGKDLDHLFKIIFFKKSDHTYWKISFNNYFAFKQLDRKYASRFFLKRFKENGFYQLQHSPWLRKLLKANIPCIREHEETIKHFAFVFSDQVIELITSKIKIEQLKE